MKKILFVATMLFMASTVIISCKKDDATSTSIVGTWEATTTHAVTVDSTETPPTTTVDDSTYIHGHAGKITFNADGTYSLSDPYDTPPSTESGTYVAADGKLTTIIKAQTGDPSLPLTNGTYTISGNTLTVHDTESFPGIFSTTATIVLTRQ